MHFGLSILRIVGIWFGIVVGLGNLANLIVSCLMLVNITELNGIIKVFGNTDSYTNILVESEMDKIKGTFSSFFHEANRSSL